MKSKDILIFVLLTLLFAGRVFSQIEAGRAIQITIAGVPVEDKAMIDAVYSVSNEGVVMLPLIGKLQAAGKTPGQLSGEIQKAYVDGKIFVAPQIQIMGYSGCILGAKIIHVGGQVRKPGQVDFADAMTLGDAIKAAGGVTPFGSLKRVNIYRDGEKTTYDMTKEKNMKIPVKLNDSILVQQKNFFGN